MSLKVGEWAIVDGPDLHRIVHGPNAEIYEEIESHPWNGFICMIMEVNPYPSPHTGMQCVVRFWNEDDPRNEMTVSSLILKPLLDVTPERATELLDTPKPGPHGEPPKRRLRRLHWV